MNPLRREVNMMLFSVLGSEELVQRWWTGDNVAFGFVAPQSVWDQGESGQQEVYEYVAGHVYGDGYW